MGGGEAISPKISSNLFKDISIESFSQKIFNGHNTKFAAKKSQKSKEIAGRGQSGEVLVGPFGALCRENWEGHITFIYMLMHHQMHIISKCIYIRRP